MAKNKNYEYSIKSKFGGFMPYMVYRKDDKAHMYPFHISVGDFGKLRDNGCGIAYGRTEWGPWCRLKLFKYVIVGIEIIQEPLLLERLNARYEAYLKEEV